MDRREFIQISSTLALNECFLNSAEQDSTKPNVLFIAIDDLNTWIGCLDGLKPGMPTAKTPNLDRLAQQSTLFSNAHASAPWCKPSRNGVMTGLFEEDAGPKSTEKDMEFFSGIKTIPQHFRDNGYHTLGGGKLFHKQKSDDGQIFWDEFNPFVRPINQRRQNPHKSGMAGLSERDTFDWGKSDRNESEFIDVKIADWAVSSLNRKYDKPFFMGMRFSFSILSPL